MKTKYKRNKAFSLAEILIVIIIIGVIAAISVPIIIGSTNKKEIIFSLQKAYSTLSQATNKIIAENGSPKCNDGGWACSLDNVYDMYRKYLNNAKECGQETGCFSQNQYKYLNGNIMSHIESSIYRRLVLTDGIQVNFDAATRDCTSWGTNKICAVIWVDVNGVKKPNVIGVDVHTFYLLENKLYPAGCGDIVGSFESGNRGHGKTCSVIREGKID